MKTVIPPSSLPSTLPTQAQDPLNAAKAPPPSSGGPQGLVNHIKRIEPNGPFLGSRANQSPTVPVTRKNK